MEVSKKSKKKIVEDTLLDENGCSELIHRYSLKPPLSWTSGDSIFRSDSSLGQNYEFFRFCKNFNPSNHSQCWDFTIDDEVNMRNIHSKLEWKKGGRTVEYIQFFGKKEKNQEVVKFIKDKIENAKNFIDNSKKFFYR